MFYFIILCIILTALGLFAGSLLFFVLSIRQVVLELFPEWKKRTLVWYVSLPVVLGFLIYLYLDKVNAVIVAIHWAAIWGVCRILYWGWCKWRKSVRWSALHVALVALILTTIYLAHGWILCHRVVETQYQCTLPPEIDLDRFRIAMFGDSHLGTTMDGKKFEQIMGRICAAKPDLLLIAGDFVDDDTTRADMETACQALGNCSLPYGVFFVFGNHDRGYRPGRDFSAEDLVAELQKNNVRILEDQVFPLPVPVTIIGRQDRGTAGRKSAAELMKAVPRNNYAVMVDHQPNDFAAEAEAGADLVLSGHAHGGQFIPIGLISSLFNDSCYGKTNLLNTTFIVTSGLGSWELKLKTGTVSEYVIIDLTKNP